MSLSVITNSHWGNETIRSWECERKGWGFVCIFKSRTLSYSSHHAALCGEELYIWEINKGMKSSDQMTSSPALIRQERSLGRDPSGRLKVKERKRRQAKKKKKAFNPDPMTIGSPMILSLGWACLSSAFLTLWNWAHTACFGSYAHAHLRLFRVACAPGTWAFAMLSLNTHAQEAASPWGLHSVNTFSVNRCGPSGACLSLAAELPFLERHWDDCQSPHISSGWGEEPSPALLMPDYL